MNRYRLKTMLAAIMLLTGSAMFALAEVRTCELDNAIPKTSLSAFTSTAFIGSGTMDTPLRNYNKISNGVGGVRGSMKLSPKLEPAIWIYSNGLSTAIELQAKYLIYSKDETHLSFVPCVYNSAGRRQSRGYEENATLNGFGLPLIFTWDSKRDLVINMSAGINGDWITSNMIVEPGYYPGVPDFHKSIWVPRAHLNFSFTAFAGDLSLSPELGVTIVNAHDQGRIRFNNMGVTLGVWK